MKIADVDVVPSPTTRNLNDSIERTPSSNADNVTPPKGQKEKTMMNADADVLPSPMTRNVNERIERTLTANVNDATPSKSRQMNGGV